MNAWLSEIGPGWHDLVRPLIEQCRIDHIPIYRVKQKFGGLRFQAATGTGGNASDWLREMIHLAEQQSFSICEQCGQPGRLRSGPCIRTLCDAHDVGRLQDLMSRIYAIVGACDGEYKWAVNRIGAIAAAVLTSGEGYTDVPRSTGNAEHFIDGPGAVQYSNPAPSAADRVAPGPSNEGHGSATVGAGTCVGQSIYD